MGHISRLPRTPRTTRPDSRPRPRRQLGTRLGTVTLAAVAALFATAVPGAAADPAADPAPNAQGPSVLVMTVSPGTATDPGPGRSAVLTCGTEPGGDHPAPVESCAALLADGLDFTSRPGLQVMCPDLVAPVTVTATGVWNGRPVDYQHTYANGCLLRRATGVLFAF
ncbi:SSI family serine proteinase inhibitor [Streptacidiphilus jiangxiensis]|uniref:Subtilisin inhibitor-like n=1 Tax=Streptacidiphilus jiangxiensis TaxID=235985 RepID=A0A1H7N6V6_STRJI|nr:SSI family serine proteinase inhibitor [Streptacidiphilus jiangxiensis]SEL19164.1 Subtilisin inhibitor-like [Streptacidiphilus jiangxiensis]